MRKLEIKGLDFDLHLCQKNNFHKSKKIQRHHTNENQPITTDLHSETSGQSAGSHHCTCTGKCPSCSHTHRWSRFLKYENTHQCPCRSGGLRKAHGLVDTHTWERMITFILRYKSANYNGSPYSLSVDISM